MQDFSDIYIHSGLKLSLGPIQLLVYLSNKFLLTSHLLSCGETEFMFLSKSRIFVFYLLPITLLLVISKKIIVEL